MAVTTLAAWCADRAPEFDGITVTGGEPFEQYPALMAFSALVRRVASLPVMVYTGFALAELVERHPDRAFLNLLDALVDGPYVATDNRGEGWRGSANQRFFEFRAGKAVECSEGFVAGAWSVTVGHDQQIFFAGIPRPGDIEALEQTGTEAEMLLRFD